MRVDDLDVLPAEADAPLIVDANAVLAGPIAFEFLQAVAGRDAQILELLGGVHEAELAQHEALELRWEAADRLSLEQALGVPIGETVDHPE